MEESYEMKTLCQVEPKGAGDDNQCVEHPPEGSDIKQETLTSRDDQDTFVLARLGKKQVLKVCESSLKSQSIDWPTMAIAQLRLHVHGGLQLHCPRNLGRSIHLRS